MPELDKILEDRVLKLEKQNLKRTIRTTARHDGVHILRNGREYISFSCNDYLGLSHHPEVIKAAIAATKKYGAGAGSSRLITGNNPLYDELENLIAEIKGTEAACVFGSGYLTNIGTISALAGKGDLIIYDRLIHSSIHAGINLSGAIAKPFSHNSSKSASNILSKNRNKYYNCLVITENVFSMDGDVASLKELSEIAGKYDAWLMADDAHGLGVISNMIKPKIDVQMGTLSKAVGSYGGYVCGSDTLINYLKTSARSLIYSTALPPSILASSIAALEVIKKDKNLCSKPIQKARLFTKLLGLPEAQSAIVPIILGNENTTLSASEELEKAGFVVVAIRPPTVPNGTSRLRFTFSALHEDRDIKRLAELIRKKGWIGTIKS